MSLASTFFVFLLVLSRFTINDVLESNWDVSSAKEDISDSEDRKVTIIMCLRMKILKYDQPRKG